MTKAVIIDDERQSREFIEKNIQRFFPQITITAKAPSVVEGIKAITKYKPDMVFLDIEMQDGNGFDVLDAIAEKKFNFLFITAYNQYAVRAFKYSAVDYLLKPININELKVAINKMLETPINPNGQSKVFSALKDNIYSKKLLKIAIPSCDGFEYLKIQDIIRFEADGRYTHIHISDGRKMIISRTLRDYEDLIIENHFFRPHKSHLINLQHVKMYNKKDGGLIVMEDGSCVAISRNKREEFLNLMNNFSPL